MIGNLIDANVDAEINDILVKHLFDAPATGIKKDLQILMIDSGNEGVLYDLVFNIFSEPKAKDLGELLKLLIEKAPKQVLYELPNRVFKKPHAESWLDLLRLLLERPEVDLYRVKAYVLDEERINKNPDKYEVLRTAVEITDVVSRKEYLEKHYKNQDFLMEDKSSLKEPTAPKVEVQEVKAKGTPTKGKNQEVKPKASSAPKVPIQNIKMISSQLNENDIVSIENKAYKVLKTVASGRRGVVFEVLGEDGVSYALKVAKDKSPETLKSLKKESSKAKEWQALGLEHSQVLVQADTYVLKTWIPGMTGEEVISRYKSGESQYKHALEQLTRLVSLVQSKGAYIGDFRPPNVIWTGKAWVIIDSGGIDKNLNETQVMSKWNAIDEKGLKFERRWQMPVPQNPGLCKGLFL